MISKKFFIQTFGCQMNVYDSSRVAGILAGLGYHAVEDPKEADLILVNTCSVREKPETKVYSALGRFQPLKKRNPALLIGVLGCVAQQEGDRLFSRVPFLDFVVGTKEMGKIPEILESLRTSRKPRSETGMARIDAYAGLPVLAPVCPSRSPTAFVSIMQGCDNFCSFCVVPFVRGREMSRPAGDILREIRALSEGGVKEVTLLGQNVNSYLDAEAGTGFVDLLEAVQEIPGIERIRFTTSHPKDLSPQLIRSFGRMPKLCEHIHLPLQSASDGILQAMNRGYSIERYEAKVGALREASPEISVTTDLIVGFPGEAEADFQETLRAVRRIRFDEFFSFRYSDRPHTRALLLPEKVPEDVKQRRLHELQELQKDITFRKNRAWEGRDVEVLVEGPSKADPAERTGRTRTNRIVNFPGTSVCPGDLVMLRVTQAFAHSLRGEPITV